MSLLQRWLPVAAWSAVILLTSNNQFSSAHTGSWIDTIFGFAVPHWVNVAFRKTLHLTGYGILGALAYRATRRRDAAGPAAETAAFPGAPASSPAGREASRFPLRDVATALLVVAFVASIDEFHQSMLAARRGSPWDVLLDVTGGLLAIWLMIRVQQYRPRRRTSE